MSHQVSSDPPISGQSAPQIGSLLQVLSNVPTEIVLQEAATAEIATIDALLTRFEDMTSILKQAKRERKLKRKGYADGLLMEQQSLDLNSRTLIGNRARIPTEVLRQLTQSGYLATADLAKTLLLTCKCYVIDLGQEYVHEHLCKSRWRNITKLPPCMIADRGYYWLFRNLSRPGEYRKELSPIPPPTFDYDAMLFSVSIRDGSGKEIVSEVFCGEQLETWKEDGTAGRDGTARKVLEQPITIGTYESASIAAKYVQNADRGVVYDPWRNWSVTVHLFRMDENKCCCVHESDSCYWEEEHSNSPSVALVKSQESSSHLELDEEGKLLERRVQELDRYSLPVEREGRESFQGIKFGVHLHCCIQEQEYHQDDPMTWTADLVLEEIELMDWTTDELHELYIDDHEEPHGVTLPRLLEHLKGWNPDD
jgi:hypothetical protein